MEESTWYGRDPEGSRDPWTSYSYLSFGLPLLTRNGDEFERVPELVVVDYTTALA